MVRAGMVEVAGRVWYDEAAKVDAMMVTIAREPLDHPGRLLLLMHKPEGFVCSHDDGGRLIYSLLPERWQKRNPKLSTVGRLDRDVSGAILLTDDGALLHRLTSPKYAITKLYEATLAEPINPDAIELFASGTLMLKGEEKPCLPARLEIVTPTLVHLELVEGRYHQVKRMFAAIGNRVVALKRLKFGRAGLNGLGVGEYREILIEEIV